MGRMIGTPGMGGSLGAAGATWELCFKSEHGFTPVAFADCLPVNRPHARTTVEQAMEEAEAQKRKAAKIEAERSRDIVISYGMSDAALTSLVGKPTSVWDDNGYGGQSYRILRWEYDDGTLLRCLCRYSQVTGTYNMMAIGGNDMPKI